MNQNNNKMPENEVVKHVAEKPKSLTPAILGMPNSHGVKFSANMTSEDKKELLTKLEEWRKARKEKLAASILAKQKQIDKPKLSLPSVPLKSKPVPVGEDGSSKLQDKQSVFERLYKNNGKVKKPEVTNNFKLQQAPKTNFRNSAIFPPNYSNKPEKISLAKKDEMENPHKISGSDTVTKTIPEEVSLAKKDEVESLHKISASDTVTKSEQEPLSVVEISVQNNDLNSVNDNVTTGTEMSQNCPSKITEENFKEGLKVTKPVHQISDQLKMAHSKNNGHPVLKSLPKTAVEAQKGKNLRRSISMMFRQKHKAVNAVRRSISANNLPEINLDTKKADNLGLQMIPLPYDSNNEKGTKNVAVAKTVMFCTPKNTKSLTSTSLRTKLEDWLKVNGHPLEGYRHLRCFGITKVVSNNVKPLPEAPAVVALDDTFENSYYATAPNTPLVHLDKKAATPPTVVQQMDINEVENWLKELHRLIVELKYPSERCEEWLTAIRKKCASCSQLPIYWECLAALNESKGDLKSAIEDYERAIIKGGEVDAVGESLAQLFDKMVINQEKRSKPKLEKGLDPKNIFKSTIIKFALQQKALKKLSSEIDPGVREQLYIATPVRRSTRLQTPFKSTDEVSSLQTLTPEFRKNLTFKPNESLLRGD